MQDKAEIAGLAVKGTAGLGFSVTSWAWWGANSDALGAIAAVISVIILTITAIINWHYKYNHKPKMEANDDRR